MELYWIDYVAVCGCFSGLIGSILLAFSLTGWLVEIRNSVGFNNVSIKSILANMAGRSRDLLNFDGLLDNMEKAEKKSLFPTRLGVLLLIVAFLFQSVTVLHGVYERIQSKRNAESITSTLKKIDTRLAVMDSIVALNGTNSTCNSYRIDSLYVDFSRKTAREEK